MFLFIFDEEISDGSMFIFPLIKVHSGIAIRCHIMIVYPLTQIYRPISSPSYDAETHFAFVLRFFLLKRVQILSDYQQNMVKRDISTIIGLSCSIDPVMFFRFLCKISVSGTSIFTPKSILEKILKPHSTCMYLPTNYPPPLPHYCSPFSPLARHKYKSGMLTEFNKITHACALILANLEMANACQYIIS